MAFPGVVWDMTLPLGPSGRVGIVPGVVDVCVLRRRPVRGRQRADAGAGYVWQTLLLQRTTGTRCPGSWELVHGRIEPGERPEHAAVREVREETGFDVSRLYSITVNAFYLAGRDIQATVVFAAVVGETPPAATDDTSLADPTLSPEHCDARWLSLTAARRAVTWPREQEALQHVAHLLRTGDAGVAEDVLRVVLER